MTNASTRVTRAWWVVDMLNDDRIIAVQPMVICFSCEKQVSVAPKDVCRPSIFFFPHHYLLALAVNKSPAVYILSPALDRLWRENGGSVNRLFLSENARFLTSFNNKITAGEWNDAQCLFVYTLSTKKLQLCKMFIVLGTFTPTSLKFVDLSHHAQS